MWPKNANVGFKVIGDLNRDLLLPAGWRFEGVGWDRTHYPRIAWLSPQEAINRGIPQSGDCDIAVFVFWKRVGTPLPPDKFTENGAGPAPTGSLWEFHHAMESPKSPWVLVYRCERPPVMSDKDGDPVEFGQQVKGVQDFSSGFKDEQARYRADYHGYKDAKDFEARLKQDLKSFINHLQPNVTPRHPEALPAGQRVPATYLQRLKAHVAHIELLGLDLKESITNGLPQVYVPAVTTRVKQRDEPKESDALLRKDPRELILDRLGESSLYLPGDPGSGKSTFCQWVVYVTAHGEVPAPGTLRSSIRERNLPR
jgi:hypothetical protein